MKKIVVEPDYGVWKEYAYKKGIHAPAITTYLEIKKNDFYRIENTIDGVQFMTARGWEDLSTMIKLLPKNRDTPWMRISSASICGAKRQRRNLRSTMICTININRIIRFEHPGRLLFGGNPRQSRQREI